MTLKLYFMKYPERKISQCILPFMNSKIWQKMQRVIRIQKIPSCIDLILRNNPKSFQNSGVIETGLSDFHKMKVTVMRTTFEKLKPNIIHNRDYRQFSNDKLRENLISRLSTENIRVDCNVMEKFLQICIKDELAPQKKNYSRGNNPANISTSDQRCFNVVDQH